MRWSIIVFVVLVTVSTATAQVNDSGATVVRGFPGVVSPIAPIPYGVSNSVLDHNGRLLIFDLTYENPPLAPGQPVVFRVPPTIKTRITIIEADGSTKHDSTYSGSFQVIGAGRNAVYAIVTDYAVSAMPMPASAVITRRLVAVGLPFPILPSIDLPRDAQVRVSAVGDNGAPDMIAAVNSLPINFVLPPAGIMAPVPSLPIQQRNAQMFQFDGTSFKPLTPTPVPLP